ncbi:hypothetical protein ABT144_34300 [Streptomyces sp. NPDC002039]|uniref:hypothetical protein n=1 Tax=Streptomyces sp. NPDC002039 TaxID=3154660 RepID=UPI003330E2C6
MPDLRAGAPGARSVHNPHGESTSIAASLLAAADAGALDHGAIVTYGDIVVEPRVYAASSPRRQSQTSPTATQTSGKTPPLNERGQSPAPCTSFLRAGDHDKDNRRWEDMPWLCPH